MSIISIDALIRFDDILTAEQKILRDTVKKFVNHTVIPNIKHHFEQESFPKELIKPIADLGMLGAHIQGYECPGMDSTSYGLLLEQLEYGDSAIRSFVSVQSSLVMHAVYQFGSEEQKRYYLPKMARGEIIGCFGLTEPSAGSDPGAMKTLATLTNSGYSITGSKMWITSAPIAQMAIIWAKTEPDNPKSIRGFIVDTKSHGISIVTMKGKFSLRASYTGEIYLDNVQIPKENILPHSTGLSSALACLNQARFGIAWGVIGAAKYCYETAVSYAKERTVFGVPIAKKQLIQEKLVNMANEISKAQLLVAHLSQLKDKGLITPYMVSLAKRNNVQMALDIARNARDILGANGIMLDYQIIRHLLNLETVSTYEGTHDVHTLILGRGLTGEDAF